MMMCNKCSLPLKTNDGECTDAKHIAAAKQFDMIVDFMDPSPSFAKPTNKENLRCNAVVFVEDTFIVAGSQKPQSDVVNSVADKLVNAFMPVISKAQS